MKTSVRCVFALVLIPLCCFGTRAAAQALPTTTTLAVTSTGGPATTVASGTAVTLTATVMSTTTPVTLGRVNFCDASVSYCTDIHQVGTATLTSAGTAVMKLVPGIGSHIYKAVFVGTPNSAPAYLGSTSGAAGLSVTGLYPTKTTITASGSNGNYTLTATVTGVLNATNLSWPSGPVSFIDTTDNDDLLATAWLGQGMGVTFLNSDTPATYNQPQSVTVADFNGDGILDLAVTAGCCAMNVLLGNGDGTFTTGPGVPLSNYNVSNNAAVADFNGDGIPDLALSFPDDNTVLVLLGNGDGTFNQEPPILAGEVFRIGTGDFNGDGKADLFVLVDKTLTIMLGNGDGTFTAMEPITLAGPYFYPYSVAVGDFNGDGIPDLAVAIFPGAPTTPGSVSILLGNGDGTFTPQPQSPATGDAPDYIVAADFNGDGILDLAVANSNSNIGDGNEPGTVTVLLGNGDGTFTPTASATTVGIDPASLAVGDFNGDGIPDLATADGGNTSTILLGNGDGTFANPVTVKLSGNPLFVAAGDFNDDGLADLAVLCETANALPILLSQDTETATATASDVVVGGSESPARKGAAGFDVPAASGSHSVIATYGGVAALYNGSKSKSISLGTGAGNGATATPMFSLTAGTYPPSQSVEITDTTSGATIYYTTNGTTPTTSSTKYTRAIKVAASETLQAIAVAPEYSQSAVNSVTYTIEKLAATPKFSPTAKTYTSAQSVTITDATSGTAIYYTTDGTTPTTSSSQYTSAIKVSSTETLQAIAVATGYLPSVAASATYIITPPAAKPVFAPAPGDYNSVQSVEITDATPEATIYYTTDGTTPTISSTQYNGAITVSATETIKAIAVATGYSKSTLVSAKYTIK